MHDYKIQKYRTPNGNMQGWIGQVCSQTYKLNSNHEVQNDNHDNLQQHLKGVDCGLFCSQLNR